MLTNNIVLCELVQIQNGVIWIGNGSQCLATGTDLETSGQQAFHKTDQNCYFLLETFSSTKTLCGYSLRCWY